MTTVLLVEDDGDTADALSTALRDAAREVVVVDGGLKALESIVEQPDVIVLERCLPDIDGLEVLGMIRGHGDVPVIVVSDRDDEHEAIRALDAGADDYLIKPFSGEYLNARIRAVLRRGRAAPSSLIRIGELHVDLAAREVTLRGQKIELHRKGFDLLAALAERTGEVVTRSELAARIWGDPHLATDATLDYHISALRRALGETAAKPCFIRAVRGVGLKLVDATGVPTP